MVKRSIIYTYTISTGKTISYLTTPHLPPTGSNTSISTTRSSLPSRCCCSPTKRFLRHRSAMSFEHYTSIRVICSACILPFDIFVLFNRLHWLISNSYPGTTLNKKFVLFLNYVGSTSKMRCSPTAVRSPIRLHVETCLLNGSWATDPFRHVAVNSSPWWMRHVPSELCINVSIRAIRSTSSRMSVEPMAKSTKWSIGQISSVNAACPTVAQREQFVLKRSILHQNVCHCPDTTTIWCVNGYRSHLWLDDSITEKVKSIWQWMQIKLSIQWHSIRSPRFWLIPIATVRKAHQQMLSSSIKPLQRC